MAANAKAAAPTAVNLRLLDAAPELKVMVVLEAPTVELMAEDEFLLASKPAAETSPKAVIQLNKTVVYCISKYSD